MNERSPTRAWQLIGAGALLTTLVGASALGTAGCEASETLMSGARDPSLVRNTAIVHEPCDTKSSQAQALDANLDGKPEVVRVYRGGTEVCRVSDLNGDGKPNMYEYFAQDGKTVRRREYDYDDNGVVNEIEIYEGGRLTRREMDTTNQGRIDTWDTFDTVTGKISKRERDGSLDGRVDQWWVWNGDSVEVSVDRDGDGKPDPEASLLIGPNGQPAAVGGPAASAAPPAAPSAPPKAPEPAAPAAPSAAAPDSDAGVVAPHRRAGGKK